MNESLLFLTESVFRKTSQTRIEFERNAQMRRFRSVVAIVNSKAGTWLSISGLALRLESSIQTLLYRIMFCFDATFVKLIYK